MPDDPGAGRRAVTFDLLRDRFCQALYDPGSVVGRRLGPTWGVGQPGYAHDQETLWDWQLRAVLQVARPDGQQDAALGPPMIEVLGADLAHVVSPHGGLLSALNYEQLLILQERIEDAVAEMALMPSTTPSNVKRPRKERNGDTH